MSDAPRRSSRKSTKKSNSMFNVGDIVEITRNGIVAEGRLAYNLTEGPSANPRWLIKFDREAWKDEELYERSFGALLRKAGDESDRASPTDYPNKKSRTKTSSGSSEEDSRKGSKRKNVTFSESPSPVGSDSSSIIAMLTDDRAAKRARAREQRIARRQARIDEEEVVSQQPNKRLNNDSNSRVEENEEVIKVPMLTGTLYLYRGLNRRAEFIRSKC